MCSHHHFRITLKTSYRAPTLLRNGEVIILILADCLHACADALKGPMGHAWSGNAAATIQANNGSSAQVWTATRSIMAQLYHAAQMLCPSSPDGRIYSHIPRRAREAAAKPLSGKGHAGASRHSCATVRTSMGC